MTKKTFLDLATNKALKHYERTLLFYMLGKSDNNGCLSLSQMKIADAIKVDQGYISRSVRKLSELGYLSFERNGRNYHYQLNNNLIY